MSHKEEGNEYFKKKNYKLAVEEYSAGIKEKCTDVNLNAVLYCNRAAAHYHLGEREEERERDSAHAVIPFLQVTIDHPLLIPLWLRN